MILRCRLAQGTSGGGSISIIQAGSSTTEDSSIAGGDLQFNSGKSVSSIGGDISFLAGNMETGGSVSIVSGKTSSAESQGEQGQDEATGQGKVAHINVVTGSAANNGGRSGSINILTGGGGASGFCPGCLWECSFSRFVREHQGGHR